MACLFSPSQFIDITNKLLIELNENDYKMLYKRATKNIVTYRIPIYIEWLCGIIHKLDIMHLDVEFLENQFNKMKNF